MIEHVNTPTISRVNAERLEKCGIHNLDELRHVGSEEAFMRLRVHYPDTCFNTLCTLEGAIQGVEDWHMISDDRRGELRLFYRSFEHEEEVVQSENNN